MKTNYEAPQVEVIEIEVESILCASEPQATTTSTSISSVKSGTTAW